MVWWHHRGGQWLWGLVPLLTATGRYHPNLFGTRLQHQQTAVSSVHKGSCSLDIYWDGRCIWRPEFCFRQIIKRKHTANACSYCNGIIKQTVSTTMRNVPTDQPTGCPMFAVKMRACAHGHLCTHTHARADSPTQTDRQTERQHMPKMCTLCFALSDNKYSYFYVLCIWICFLNADSLLYFGEFWGRPKPGHWQLQTSKFLPCRAHRACYNSILWLPSASVHHHRRRQMLSECVGLKRSEFIAYEELRYTKYIHYYDYYYYYYY